ncbi:MAG: hypothetical protein K2J39_09435 [Ruminococcus sp.]|nr:hypothetical protein [Ruminococcus sp.]
MNKKSKKTLKNAFNIPEPKRKDEFLNSLPAKQKKSFSFNIPLYVSTAVTAVLIIGIWGGIKNLPHFDQPSNIDTPTYSGTTSLSEHTESTTVQTTAVTSTVKNTTETSAVPTLTTKTTKTSGAGTVRTETTTPQTSTGTETFPPKTTVTTTKKESNNITHKPTTEIHTTEITSEPETESPETTIKTSTASHTVTETIVRTTVRTTTKTTTPSRTKTTTTTTITTTTTTSATETVTETTTTTAESEVNFVTTTTFIDNVGIPGNIGSGSSQTTIGATMDSPPVPVTTTTPAPPTGGSPIRDFTVVPAVRYYPEGEIYFIDSESNDSMPPTTAPDDTGIFRQMTADSDLIAIVEVDEIIYTGLDGVPYTQENVTVKDVIYGDMQTDSRISVYCMGGYIPAEEYFLNVYEENVTVLDYAGNRKFSEVGDMYMCFLQKKDGIYYLTGLNDISKFECQEDYFVNFHNNQHLTLQDIQNFINNS